MANTRPLEFQRLGRRRGQTSRASRRYTRRLAQTSSAPSARLLPADSSSSGSSGASGSLFPFRVNGGLPEAQTNRPATQITLNYTGSNPQDGREMARIILGELQGMGALG